MKKTKCEGKWPVYKIERKTGIRFYAVFTPPVGKQLSKTFSKKADAINWLKLKHSALEVEECKAKFEYLNRRMSWLCEYWLENYSKVYKQHSSYTRDCGFVKNQILPYFGSKRICEVTTKQLEAWMVQLRAGLSPKTCNDLLGLVRKIFNDACRWDFASQNPATHVTRFKIPEKDFVFWTFDEKLTFLNFVFEKYPEHYLLFLMAVSTGLRAGELKGLQWDCLDLQRGQVTVKRIYCQTSKVIKETTKSSKIRRVPLNRQLRDALVIEKANSGSKLVFTSSSYNNLSRLTRNLCIEAGVTEISFHSLRHVFASHLAMSGVALYELQKLMGHHSIQMTERYSHLIPEALDGLTEVLAMPVGKSKNVIDLNDRR